MDDLVAMGILAYQDKEYHRAIELLSQSAKYDWQGQLYLAMSYFLAGQPVDAQDLFLRLSNECPEAEIRGKAQAAFVAVRDKLTEDREKEKQQQEEQDLGLDLEWHGGH